MLLSDVVHPLHVLLSYSKKLKGVIALHRTFHISSSKKLSVM